MIDKSNNSNMEETTTTGSIYMHTNMVTGLSYIGQTIKAVTFRFRCHINEAKREGNAGSHFHRALNKYGEHVWDTIILEDGIPREDLDNKECFYIEKYNTYYEGYNMTKGGISGKGQAVSEETRKKLSEAGKGRTVSEETRNKISVSNKGNKQRLGHTNSAEHRRKISESRRGAANPFFRPWYIKYPDGRYEEHYTTTKAQYAIDNGFNIKTFTGWFSKNAHKEIQTGSYKGIIVGNIKELTSV